MLYPQSHWLQGSASMTGRRLRGEWIVGMTLYVQKDSERDRLPISITEACAQ